MQNKVFTTFFVFIDWLGAVLAWVLFYYLRKVYIEEVDFSIGESFYWGVTLIPIIWLILYYLQGTYYNIKRLYRFKVFNLTFSLKIPKEFLEVAQNIIGTNPKKNKWMAHFGTKPSVAQIVLHKSNLNPRDLLLALHFLKTYPTEDTGLARWNMSDSLYARTLKKSLRIMYENLPI